MIKGIKFLILIVGIAGGLICFNFNIVSAQQIGVTVSPLTFELTANPGDTLTNTLKIYNPTESIISIKMEVEDFRPIGEVGQVIVEPEEEMIYSLKRWVKTTPAEFTLEPREQKFVDFAIEVPENAEPGGKYGSVLASTTGVIGEKVTGAAIAQKVGALVLLTVAGEVKEELKVKEFSAPSFLEYGPVPFVIRFENTGTVHARPRGYVSITNIWGKKATDVEFPQLNVIPGAIRKIETKWDNKWLFGKYTATLVGSYGTANLPFNPAVLTFWVFPWKIALGILLALALILTFFVKTRKRWQMAFRVLIRGEK
ncbi:DUF916 domain-containing protein [Patescibacteria group bacterium]|nr:DUF916 domain-containing protein [Patescibacteria group bacterium]